MFFHLESALVLHGFLVSSRLFGSPCVMSPVMFFLQDFLVFCGVSGWTSCTLRARRRSTLTLCLTEGLFAPAARFPGQQEVQGAIDVQSVEEPLKEEEPPPSHCSVHRKCHKLNNTVVHLLIAYSAAPAVTLKPLFCLLIL